MKKILLHSFLFFMVLSLSAQEKRPKKVTQETWLDSASFFNGPEPIVVGFGNFSDSLKSVYATIFFVANGNEYFRINNAADYYLWFTKKYPFLFENPDAYALFYLQEESKKMIEFILTNYRGKKFPLKFSHRIIDSEEAPTMERFEEVIPPAENISTVGEG